MRPEALSGRSVDELDVDRVREGDLGTDDIRIAPQTLVHQAEQAELAGNPQLAGNLRRAAEMTALSDDELMRMYEALRPGRSSLDQLRASAADLASQGMPRCAALFEEAAAVYERRGLTR